MNNTMGYQRQYTEYNDGLAVTGRPRLKKPKRPDTRSRQRALARLALRHPEEYQQLLKRERRKQGL